MRRFELSGEISFTRAQRLMHWTIGAGCAALFITGLPVYLAQFLVVPPVPTPLQLFYWGLQVVVWRNIHIYLALSIVLVVAVHSLWDTYRIKTSERMMRVSRADLAEAWDRARSFLGFSSDGHAQATKKYDFFHKALHWTLIVLGAFLLISGLAEWEAIQIQGIPLFVWLDRINNTFMDGFLRTGHLVAAMLFAGLLALHTYFAILPQNRPFLRAMSLGRSGVPARGFQQRQDAERPGSG